MEGHHKATVPLAHRVGVTPAIEYLLARLGCDHWHVACHREHLFVIQLTQAGQARFAVSCECTSPAEKGTAHDSQFSAISIIPMGQELDPSPETLAEIRAALADLGRSGAAVARHG